MPPLKRARLEEFDPNKSDSEDENFSPTSQRVRKTPRKSQSSRKSSKAGGQTAKGKARRKARGYDGTDVSNDEDDVSEESDDSLAFGDDGDEEDEVEMNPQTGRAMRKAAKKATKYEEISSDEEDDDEDEEEDEVEVTPTKKRKHRHIQNTEDEDDSEGSHVPKKSKIVKLKITPRPTRSTRQNSTSRSLRAPSIVEGTSAAPTRRSTRAHTEEGDEPIALSNSGKHVVRASRSPEPIITTRHRNSRGSTGRKAPFDTSTIVEDPHEASSHEERMGDAPADTTLATEVNGTDEEPKSDAVVDAMDTAHDEDALADAVEDEEDQYAPVKGDIEEDDDDEEEVVVSRTRTSRRSSKANAPDTVEIEEGNASRVSGRQLRNRNSKKNRNDQSSDFEPNEDGSDEEMSGSDKDQKAGTDSASSSRRGDRTAQTQSRSKRRDSSGSDIEELDPDELAEEAYELKATRSSRRREARHNDPDIAYVTKTRRERKPVDYSIKPLHEIYREDEEAFVPGPSASDPRPRSGRAAANKWQRTLHTTYGPFGGGSGPQAVLPGPWGNGPVEIDSDSSDDENMKRAPEPGMTPTAAKGKRAESLATGGTPANFGKIKSQKALADADPLGVDQYVDFSKVGGLQGHIDQLKEMVQMPLLYPELFMRFGVTPPRGVLFHGPPGTGKTLLARALAAQSSQNGQKITFYMRKGADALSKWVGEAERQLRLLFEEARKTQPSIIFFDEIDGLAPVRSSKQEQIHASIVSTLLALMDGMDGRGQVIVIGATNRPDNIDPALRRPGRFDREFYFPLPDVEARKSILGIHTAKWNIDEKFKDDLARVTKGYGGADIRALCTEAALNAMQRTYPQIYSSKEKLLVDPERIKVTARDFMMSVKKMVPSSERSAASGAAPLPKNIEPLLREKLDEVIAAVDSLLPDRKKMTALEEAMYELDDDDDGGFGRETMLQEFVKSKVFRPRLLICGKSGMGQNYIGAALLNHFEGIHVQNLDLPTLYSDSSRSPEAALIQIFTEVKRHKPSVIYMPGVDVWYQTVPENVITTFAGLLRQIPPTDPVLVLGICETARGKLGADMIKDLFGFSKDSCYKIKRPDLSHRRAFFSPIIDYCKRRPDEFPEPMNRKKRRLEILPLAPPPPPPGPPSKDELRAQRKKDHFALNQVKIMIQPIMDQIHRAYKQFRNPAIPQHVVQYVYDELNPDYVRADLPQARPFELSKDKDGVPGLHDTVNDLFFYNLETSTIEERLSNGFYARPQDFLTDIKKLARDARSLGDRARTLKANELVANIEVDVADIEMKLQAAGVDYEGVHRRQGERAKERELKQQQRQNAEDDDAPARLGEPVPGAQQTRPDVVMEDVTQRTTQLTNMDPPQSGATTQISQRSAFQQISHGISPKDMINDASTTTSGKKTSDGHSTQATNGVHSSPSNVIGHLPDTQASASQPVQASQPSQDEPSSEEWIHSVGHAISLGVLNVPSSQTPSSGSQSQDQPGIPAVVRGPQTKSILKQSPTATSAPPHGLANLLNSPSPAALPNTQSQPSDPRNKQSQDSHPPYNCTESFIATLERSLAEGTSGLSVEQLIQTYAMAMQRVWAWRGEWDRDLLVADLSAKVEHTVRDIEDWQGVLKASQEVGDGFVDVGVLGGEDD